MLPTDQWKPATRRAIWESHEGRCGICGESVPLEKMHLDHITPQAGGGLTVEENLRPTHPRCNLKRRDHPSLVRVGRTLQRVELRIDPDLYDWLVAQAQAQRPRRSLNLHIETLLEQARERSDG